MEKIKIGLLDLFAYIIPGGIVILIVCYFLHSEGVLPEIRLTDIINYDIKFFPGMLLIVLAYLTGFTTGIFGRWSLLAIEKRLFKQSEITTMSRTEKYCIARHHSPSNFNNIDQLNVAKRMTSNLGIIAILSSVALLIFKIDEFNVSCLLAGVLTGIVMSFLFFISSWEFHKMELEDVDSIIRQIKKLDDRKAS